MQNNKLTNFKQKIQALQRSHFLQINPRLMWKIPVNVSLKWYQTLELVKSNLPTYTHAHKLQIADHKKTNPSDQLICRILSFFCFFYFILDKMMESIEGKRSKSICLFCILRKEHTLVQTQF